MGSNCALILAAGEGTRMKSAKPKVLLEVLFKPMLDWVIDAVEQGGVDDICVVTGHKHEQVEEHLAGKYKTVLQTERLGTGHAVMQAEDFIKEHIHDNILILAGDAPLISSDIIRSSLDFHTANNNAATVISSKINNPFGYGRIVRNKNGDFKRIVEEKEANNLEKQINEVNSGVYWFRCSVLLDALNGIVEMHDKKHDPNKEYYLTDAVEVILEKGLNVVAYNSEDPNLVLGANTRVQLAEIDNIARKAILNKNMLNGVDIPCSDGVIISPEVSIGKDTQILPGTILKGNTKIGENCRLGPNTIIEDSEIGNDVNLNSTQCYSATVKNGVTVGPFCRIRPGTVLCENVKVGNFVEFKNSTIGSKTCVAHLTYIGDTDVGSNVNFGCGCATANFNGKDKNRTTVGNNAFIGCDTCLVAPVKVGENAYTGAGSVVTEDIPDNSLAIGRSKIVIKKDWVNKKKPYRWQK